MSKAGNRLLEAARDAVVIARGDKKPARTHVPPDIDVKGIRQRLKLSQEDFAYQFGFSTNQIRDWEQQRNRPTGGMRAYLIVIDRNPDVIRQTLSEVREISKQAASRPKNVKACA